MRIPDFAVNRKPYGGFRAIAGGIYSGNTQLVLTFKRHGRTGDKDSPIECHLGRGKMRIVHRDLRVDSPGIYLPVCDTGNNDLGRGTVDDKGHTRAQPFSPKIINRACFKGVSALSELWWCDAVERITRSFTAGHYP